MSCCGGQPEPRRRRALEIVEDLSVLATLGRPFPSKKAVADFLEAHSDSFEPIHDVAWRELANLLPKLFPRAEKGVIPPIVPRPPWPTSS